MKKVQIHLEVSPATAFKLKTLAKAWSSTEGSIVDTAVGAAWPTLSCQKTLAQAQAAMELVAIDPDEVPS